MPDDHPIEEQSEKGFEEFVAAALKVDPKGLSGKHRRDDGAPDAETTSGQEK